MPESLRDALDKINKEDKKQTERASNKGSAADRRERAETKIYKSSDEIPAVQKARQDRATNEAMQQYQKNRASGYEEEFTYEHRRALKDYEEKMRQLGLSGSDMAKKFIKPLGLGLATGNPLAAGLGGIGAGISALVQQIQASGKAKGEVVNELVSQGMDPQEASDFFDQAKGYYQSTSGGPAVHDYSKNKDTQQNQQGSMVGVGLAGIPQPAAQPQPQLGEILSGIVGGQPQQPEQGQQMFQGFKRMQPVDFNQYNLRSALDQPGDYLTGNRRY